MTILACESRNSFITQSYGVMVSTIDFDSIGQGSNPCKTTTVYISYIYMS